MHRRELNKKQRRNRKKREKLVAAYNHDPLFSKHVGRVIGLLLFALIGIGIYLKLVPAGPWKNLSGILFALFFVAAIAILSLLSRPLSDEVLDQHELRCPKCGKSSVKPFHERQHHGHGRPDGTSHCYSCGEDLLSDS